MTQRALGISCSDDFEHRTKPHTCLTPDDYDDRSVNLYNMPGFVYEGMYLGFLELYYSGDNQPSELARAKDVQLITSRGTLVARRRPQAFPFAEWSARQLGRLHA